MPSRLEAPRCCVGDPQNGLFTSCAMLVLESISCVSHIQLIEDDATVRLLERRIPLEGQPSGTRIDQIIDKGSKQRRSRNNIPCAPHPVQPHSHVHLSELAQKSVATIALVIEMNRGATSYTLPGRTNDDLARLIALPMPNGPRRVAAAMRWLEGNKYIKREARTGEAPGVELLDGAGSPWRQEDSEGRYTSVPLNIWAYWWIHRLSPRTLGVYVCLADLTSGGKEKASMSGYRKAQYGFSPDTWTRAISELEGYNLIQVTSKVEKGGSRIKRRRNVYALTPNSQIVQAPAT
jgi:hypothetical protein